jgi:hypothetical protein
MVVISLVMSYFGFAIFACVILVIFCVITVCSARLVILFHVGYFAYSVCVLFVMHVESVCMLASWHIFLSGAYYRFLSN